MSKLSIVIPVYNVEKYLPLCLDSIYSQITPQCQVVLVDDGSTDKSGEICDAYAEKYSNTLVRHKENAGQGSARNEGIDICDGEYIFFVDSDDTIEPDAIANIFEYIERFGADVTVFPTHSVDENGNLLYVTAENYPHDTLLSPYRDKFLIVGAPGPCNKIIKRQLFTDNGIKFPSGVWYEDLRTLPKIMRLAESVVYSERRIYNYLQRSGSTMNNVKADRNAEIMDAMDDLIGWFKARGDYEKYHEELDYMVVSHVLLDASKRVIDIAGVSHPLVGNFRDYTIKNCTGLNNKYISAIDIKRKIIFKLLVHKMFFAVGLIFKIKKAQCQ